MSGAVTVARFHGAAHDVVADEVASALEGCEGRLARIGGGSFTVTTTRRPVWTIVLAVVLFPIGLLFLLVRDTRVGTVTVVDDGGVVAVVLSGDVAPDVRELLTSVETARRTPRSADDRAMAPGPPITPSPASPTAIDGVAPPPSTPLTGAPAAAPPPRDRPSLDDATRFRGERSAPPPGPSAMRIDVGGGTTVVVAPGAAAFVGRRPRVRDGEVAVTVDDQEVSSTHASLRLIGKSVEIVDLDSTNGTSVADGTRLAAGVARRVALPATVTVGGTDLMLSHAGPAG